ncbi:DNA polymerase III subunit alpha [Lachnoanaerobaculum gingivalis]|uniref:DNA polymerase III subunit alpha n=1 Tax=Lachnoanaerobaculum gingivalis TaxID=2490855 RepID=UPI0024A76062|nr:DNA polymerase III subunit alpha [Lachnoanaerobaculum gingivalis]WHE87022.1 DNA polymerase III subunit alpha [Lachnoanaerobaculum gingivalis]
MSFTHLHVHTGYSLLDGSCKIKEIISRAKELNMTSLAITDHGVMYGVIDFYKEAKAQGIKPILGCEVYVSPSSRFEKQAKQGDRYYHLILLAKNNKGYENLTKIVSKGFTEGFYYKPRIDFELLQEYHEGIIALSACLAGEIPKLISRGREDDARKAAQKYKELFGEDSFYLELQNHGIPEQKYVNQVLVKIGKELDIPLVATNDIHYINAEDAKAHDILLCIQTSKTVSDPDRMRYEGGQFFLKSEDEMKALFPYAQDAVENTGKIADMCDVEIKFGETKLPEYPVPNQMSAKEYLESLCQSGFERNYPDDYPNRDEIKGRMYYELGVIEKMGYIDYFLIVWDYINYARSKGISVGPGRGSAAGSVVSYCLGITDIDPIKYNLIFERFLNPERVSMPDIDVDFADERRGEVIEYVVNKYGSERVCQIITFGTLQARGVIRDVGRAMEIPYARCDSIAKMIPMDKDITLGLALERNKELKELYDSDEVVYELINYSLKLEGLPRHASIHAAGVVISKKAVEEYVPLALGVDDAVTTQFTMTTLEELGLLKMDFLGLRTLTVLQNALAMIKKNYDVDIDLKKIDYDDKKVYEFISTGKTDAVFQLESAGMQSFMKRLKPENLEDIIAGISLYRPGPMDFIPKYIAGKNNKDKVSYDTPQLISILEPTYGCIVYQEQVMQIVRDLAGYTMGGSDEVRRAMSKKKAHIMEMERKNFVYGNEEKDIKGCINNGIGEDVANKIFDEMIDFASYAFNKSHAACYAVVSYQTAYLKYYYPKEFMAASLTSVSDNPTKLIEYMGSLSDMGIKILPPDVNLGEGAFSVDEDGIRFGLSTIKGVGKAVSDAIVRERTLNGKFLSLENFINRLPQKDLNKRSIEGFIKSGALDGMEGNRHEKILNAELFIDKKSKESKAVIPGQMSFFDVVSEEDKESFVSELIHIEEYPKEELLKYEMEVMGMYVSGHPLEEYTSLLEKHSDARSIDFYPDENGDISLESGRKLTIGGLLVEVNKRFTKRGDMMAICTLEDLYGRIELVVFPKAFENYGNELVEGGKVFVKGRVDTSGEEEGKLIVDTVREFGRVKKELWIQYADKESYEEDLGNLLTDIGMMSGNDSVIIYLKKERAKKDLGSEWGVPADDAVMILGKRLGSDNVKVVEKI